MINFIRKTNAKYKSFVNNHPFYKYIVVLGIIGFVIPLVTLLFICDFIVLNLVELIIFALLGIFGCYTAAQCDVLP